MTGLSIDRLFNAALSVAAVALAGTALWRQVSPRRPLLEEPPIEYDANWRSYLAAGEADGGLEAPLTIIEFSDFECPFCRLLHETLRGAEQRLGDSLTTVFVHYPLSSHRQAARAAKGSECAREQGRFAAFVNSLFSEQDSLGLVPWTRFAVRAAVPDTEAFTACLETERAFPRIEGGKALGDRLSITATPTMFINGWRVRGSVDSATMEEMFGDILAGKTPKR